MYMKIKWNEYTWYSKMASIVFFTAIVPVWSFYIGTMYQKTKDVLQDAPKVDQSASVYEALAAAKISAQKDAQPVQIVDGYTYKNTDLGITLQLPAGVEVVEQDKAVLEINGYKLKLIKGNDVVSDENRPVAQYCLNATTTIALASINGQTLVRCGDDDLAAIITVRGDFTSSTIDLWQEILATAKKI